MTDAQLTRLYGTPDLEKTGSPAAGLLAAILGYKAIEKLRGDQEDARAQGEQNDVMARELEARDMLATRRGSRGRGGVVPDVTDYQSLGPEELAQLGALLAGSTKMSSISCAESTARELADMSKEAVGLAFGAGSLVGGVGRGIKNLGQGLFGKGTKAVGGIGQSIKAVPQRIGGALQRAGAKAEVAGARFNPKAVLSPQAKQVAARPASTAVPAAAPAAATKSKPLIGWGTKAKLLGTAGVLGTGYVAYKGLQGARDYMMQPSGGHHPGYLKHNVNEYGY